MRPLFLLAVFCLAANVTASDNLPDGHFSGAVSRFGSVQIIELDISSTADSMTARYSIPELGLWDEPASISIHDGNLSLHLWYGDFECLLHPEISEITGINEKWQPPVSLHLKQTPECRQYDTQSIDFETSAGTLRGRLYLPHGSGPHPGIVIVHGSGEQGLDTWMYRSWGNYFASRGTAALVYDKRGVGGSDGALDDATFNDLASDASFAFRALQSVAAVDSGNVGLMGISQGGWIVPLACREIEPSYVILLVAPAVDVWTQELQRIEFTMRDSGHDSLAIAHALRLGGVLFDVAAGDSEYDSYLALSDSMRRHDWYNEFFGGYTAVDSIFAWRREQYEPSSDLSSLSCPILVIYGATDVLVPPSRNVDLMRTYLGKSPADDSSIVVLPGVGHDLMTGQSLVGTSWEWPSNFWRWNRRPAQLYDSISRFVVRHVVNLTD